MTTWMLSIIGIVFIGVVVDIISPEGKMSPFIKSIFAIVTLFVVLQPIPKLLNQIVDIDWNFDASGEYVETVSVQKILYYQDELKSQIKSLGYQYCDVLIDYELNDSTAIVKKVYIDLIGGVLNDSDKHIVKYEEIRELVLNMISIDKENIVFYG